MVDGAKEAIRVYELLLRADKRYIIIGYSVNFLISQFISVFEVMTFNRSPDKERIIRPVAPRRSGPDMRVPLEENTKLDRYRIEKVLGSGSFSIVYSAIDLDAGMPVAIKEYYPKRYAKRRGDSTIVPLEGKKLLSFSDGFKRFNREAQALKNNTHPNLLALHDLFTANGTVYLVFPNCNGRDLKWFLTSFRKPLNQALIYKVFLPILSALNCLHKTQLLHLDIKPANVLLQNNGSAMLLDFGAVKVMNESGEQEPQENNQILTHGFAPPEQYSKNQRQALGPWTDIYAAAATLYYSIIGVPPAKAEDYAVESSIDVARFSRKYSSELLDTINRALSHDATYRFNCIDDFASALLEGSNWLSLREYEMTVMNYDRFEPTTDDPKGERVSIAA